MRVHRVPAALAALTCARADTDAPYPRGLVGERIPSRYDAYLRILHPFEASDGTGARRTWRSLAEEAGVPYHAELRAADLRPALSWEGDRWAFEVENGFLEPHARRCLYAHLRGAQAAQPTWFYYHDQALIWLDELVLIEAILGEVEDVEAWATEHFGATHASPTQVWPDDRTWMLHGDRDATSTFVGCSRSLADGLLGDPRIEVLEVSRTTHLDDDSVRDGDAG